MSWIVGGSVMKAMTRISLAEMGHRTRSQIPHDKRAPMHDENERPLTHRRRSAYAQDRSIELRPIDGQIARGQARRVLTGSQPVVAPCTS